MGNRRRRGGAKHRRPAFPQTPPQAPTRPMIPGTPPAGTDADKLAAVALDKAAHARDGKRSFVLANRTRCSIVAVFHCDSLDDVDDLKAQLEALQRTYHPRDEEAIGEAAPPIERPESGEVRYRGREEIRPSQMGRRDPGPSREKPGRPVFRGTPAPDADLDGLQAFETTGAEEE